VNEQDDLIGDLIADVARYHGVAISRDEPIVAVVLLNQIVLRRYLEETVAPATDAMPSGMPPPRPSGRSRGDGAGSCP
jgi:hypothetical protein